jgi:hypothetical protein
VSFVRNIFSDLVEKRLWPVALALVVGLVAVPVLVGRNSSSDTVEAALPTQAAQDGAGKASRAAVKLDTDLPGDPRNRPGRVRNPFTQPHVRNAESTTSNTAPSGGEPSPGSAGTGGTGNGGGSLPPSTAGDNTGGSDTQAPKSDNGPRDIYHLTVRVGRAGQLKTLRDIPRLSPLPSVDDPFIVYTGILKDGETAVFLLSSDAKATGDGECKPSMDDCETIHMKEGDTEFFDLTVDGASVQYELDVVHLTHASAGSSVAAAAAYERHSSAGAALLRSAHVNGSSKFKAAAAYRWLPDYGVLVRTPKQGSAHASANGATAASPADIAAALPGRPVWHWRLGA